MHRMAQIPVTLLVLAMLICGSASVYAAHPAPAPADGDTAPSDEATENSRGETQTEQQTGAQGEKKVQREKKARLSESQQQELSALYNEIFEKKKTVIRKYVEFGVMPADKGEKLISGMEERLNKLKERGYVPNWKKCRKDHHDHHGMH